MRPSNWYLCHCAIKNKDTNEFLLAVAFSGEAQQGAKTLWSRRLNSINSNQSVWKKHRWLELFLRCAKENKKRRTKK